MIAKERPPALGWRVSSLGHVLGHAGLSDIDAELEKLSMDPRRSPQQIGNAHLADKLAYLRRYSWSATTAPRLPPPVRSEPGAVPFNHGLRLHDRQGAQHLRSQTIQAGEYQTVQHPERRPFRRFPPQHVKLMTQNRVFSLKRDPRPERSDQRQPNWATDLWHKAGASPDSISVASKIEFPTGTPISEVVWLRLSRRNSPLIPALRWAAKRMLTTTLSAWLGPSMGAGSGLDSRDDLSVTTCSKFALSPMITIWQQRSMVFQSSIAARDSHHR